nr:reverse transcriptase zinc-binding domain-containing protein [Tanacetum cinerariifolium]
MELIDENLVESCNLSEASRLIQVGLLCVQNNAGDRPNMPFVIKMLDDESVLPQPKQASIFNENDLLLIDNFSSSTHAWGADMKERKITWISWKKVLADRRDGGLGVVKAIYGVRGLIDEPHRKSYPSSVWVNVIKSIKSNKDHSVDLLGYCSRKIGDENKLITISSKKVQGTGTYSLRRHPRESMGNFTLRSARIAIDNDMLIANGAPTRWCKLVPNKASIMVWRMALDRLPTRVNLDACGLDIAYVLCLICEECSESTAHVFFSVRSLG